MPENTIQLRFTPEEIAQTVSDGYHVPLPLARVLVESAAQELHLELAADGTMSYAESYALEHVASNSEG